MRTFKLNLPIVFDNDCLSCFLWTKRFDVIQQIFVGKSILVPDQVVAELAFLKQYSKYNWVYDALEREVKTGTINITKLPAGAPIAREYALLTNLQRTRAMGSGEAAVLATVKYNGGTVASNNLTDVYQYCLQNDLELINTDDILCLAVQNNILTESQASTLWDEMKARKRQLPAYNFVEAFRRYKNNEAK